MTEHTIVVLTVLRLATVALGAIFLGFTVRAYLAHRSPSMLVLLLAIGLMMAGVLVEGGLVQLDVSLAVAHVAEAAVMLVAFAVLVVSVLVHRIRLTRED